MNEQVHRDSLKDEATRAIEEARVILPGIQALFGFQLIAVFNERFDKGLSHGEQTLHLAALSLVAIAAALIMAPASYQRQAERHIVTRRFVNLASRLIQCALWPLATGLALDLFIVSRMILGSALIAAAVALVLWLFFVALWFGLPALRRHRDSSHPPAGNPAAETALDPRISDQGGRHARYP
ncbi:MAG TPA: DUF6328 family protein [Vineibacter sp.]|nr:DUF6328 family protein [Vineibacter sp.]